MYIKQHLSLNEGELSNKLSQQALFFFFYKYRGVICSYEVPDFSKQKLIADFIILSVYVSVETFPACNTEFILSRIK